MSEDSRARVRRSAYAFVAYLIVVILWGAYVRVSFSGDGCGDHWPLCRGTLTPTGDHHTFIELFHRITSALCGPLALALLVQGFRTFPKGHPVRKYAVWTFVLILTEGLFGALLVKLRKVAYDTSIDRAYLMAMHLCNTFALLFAAVGVAESVDSDTRGERHPRRHRLEMWIAFAGMMLVGTTGAVTALGDTLFPSQDFSTSLLADFDAASHPFLQLRAYHPLFALATAAYVLSLATRRWASGDPLLRNASAALSVVVVVQVGFGFANMLLHAPAAMQIGHLALADAVFVTLAMLAFRGQSSISIDAASIPASSNSR